MSAAVRQPAYSLHKATGQARVTINRRDIYLGPHNSPESLDRYNEVIAEWRIRNASDRFALTIDELSLSYLKHAKEHYRKDGRETSEVCCIRNALRFLIAVAGRTRARDFGPKLLKEVRQRMTDARLARSTINSNVGRLRRMFRWALAEELVPATIITALEAVQGLQAGRCNAKEPAPVSPVSIAAVIAIEPYVSRPIWAAVQLQLLTGMRSGEVLAMRGCDINTTGPVWEYRPGAHKTQHHGKSRIVFLGPKAQAVVREFLSPALQAFLFDPHDAKRPSGREGYQYRRDSYRRAITRGCELAFGLPMELRRPGYQLKKLPETERGIERRRRQKAAVAWRKEHCWFPHQLRHTAATIIRREAGIETARCVLGHSELSTTELYAEADLAKARDIMARVG